MKTLITPEEFYKTPPLAKQLKGQPTIRLIRAAFEEFERKPTKKNREALLAMRRARTVWFGEDVTLLSRIDMATNFEGIQRYDMPAQGKNRVQLQGDVRAAAQGGGKAAGARRSRRGDG